MIAVRNFSGYLEVGKDGAWFCVGDRHDKNKVYEDPVLIPHRCYLHLCSDYLCSGLGI